MKQLQPDGFAEANNVTPPKITSVEIDVNPDAQIVLLPPSNIYRRMEKVFGVAVDRPLDKIRQRTFIISGLDKDVEEAVEFLQQGDFSGGCKVSVDPRLLPQLIGKGGSGIRQLEDNFKCFFQTRENNDVVVYGARSNAAKAIEHISQMKSDRSGTDQVVAVVPVDHSAIARSLTTVFSKQIRETEVRHTVNTRVTSGPLPNPSTSPPPTQQPKPSTSIFNGPSITIRGANRAGVDGARIAITKLVSSLRAIEIPSTNDGIKRLFSRVSFNGEVDLNRGIRNTTGRTPALANQPSVGDRFCDLVGLNTDVAFMRHGDALIIVGTSDRTSKIYEEAKQLVEAAGYIIAKITIQPQQLPIFNSTRLAEIGEATGAAISIRRSRTGDSVHIEILGNESQKTQAIEMVDYVLKQEAVVEVVQIENRETLNQLLRQSGAQIHLLEEQNGIRISADRNQMTCSLVGSLSGTAETRKVLKEMDSKNAELESRSVSIPSPDMIRRLIGTKGSTISQIRATSRVDAIDVNDKNLVAILRGTTEACDEAERQIIELFSNSGVGREYS